MFDGPIRRVGQRVFLGAILLIVIGVGQMCGCEKIKPERESTETKPRDESTEKPGRTPIAEVNPPEKPPKAIPPESKKDEPTTPKTSQYEVATAGDINLTQPADLWGLPGQNRAVLKEKFFGKRWNLAPSGNISVETDRLLAETHPHTEWLTVTVKFRDPKDLLTFDRYKRKLNGYCVDAFTFVDCVYVK